MSSLNTRKSREAYWRSLDELADSPEYRRWVHDEFPESTDEPESGLSRRKFIQLMSASLALAWMAGCRWPREEILPFARNPEGWIPGTTKQFATTMELGGVGRGLLVTSYDGRPIKIEGNPLHPGSLGACDAITQASILELYDPDRSAAVIRREHGQQLSQTWDDFAAFASPHFAGLRTGGGAGLVILGEESDSPSLLSMRSRFLAAYPQANWLTYEPLSRDNERAGTQMVFGRPLRSHYAYDRAEVIVSFDADFLLSHPAAVRHARDFASGRRADNGKMNRLYAIESVMSLTGAAADHRVALRPSEIPGAICRLAAELFSRGAASPPFNHPDLESSLKRFLLAENSLAITPFVVRDLLACRGRSIVTVGPRQPAIVHAIAHLINAILGNVGSTVSYTEETDVQRKADLESICLLADQINTGRVGTLIILGGNPVHNAPADLGLAAAMAKIETSIHLGTYDDETSQRCRWHLPRAHYLESWGDARGWDGTLSVIQPLIEPLYGGKSSIELLALVTGDPYPTGHEIVRRTMQPVLGTIDFEAAWRRMLHDGVLNGSAFPALKPDLTPDHLLEPLANLDSSSRATVDEMELLLTQDASVYDGRFANNGWLQEMPDPLTKLTWDNAALISPATARRLDVTQGDVVQIEVKGQSLDAPVYVIPGQAAGTVALAMGYGRTACGAVGTSVGVNAYTLRTTSSTNSVSSVRLSKTGRTYELACTHDHQAIDAVGAMERASRIPALVREAELTTYLANPDFARESGHHPPLISLWTEPEYNGHRWAMAIDLSSCIGCGACMVACQAENNIPVVGKERVARGREMHWIRVDRYFSGTPDVPSILFQPVACHHCENAPCESVCPVAATTHDAEGLNVMVYNRCVGTRYCSNNCPYKVRRFNFFNYHKQTPDVTKMMYNPDVTVRSRGVMEKCTYCIQRIESVKIRAKNERRPIVDGDIVPACAQTCPAQAIVFGDLNDKTSRVAKLHEHPRAYAMLEELNVKPRTKYLAKLRNSLPELKDRKIGTD